MQDTPRCYATGGSTVPFPLRWGDDSGEVRGARWSEFDLRAALWTVPATRMKARAKHRVPLSSRAMELLREARSLGGGAQ